MKTTVKKVWTLVFTLDGFRVSKNIRKSSGLFAFRVEEKEARRVQNKIVYQPEESEFISFKTTENYKIFIKLTDIVYFNVCFDPIIIPRLRLVEDPDDRDPFDISVYLKSRPNGIELPFDSEIAENWRTIKDLTDTDGMLGTFTSLLDEDGEDVVFQNNRISLLILPRTQRK